MKKRLLILSFLFTILLATPSFVNAQGYVVWSSTGTTPGVDMPLFRFTEYFGRGHEKEECPLFTSLEQVALQVG